MATSAAPLILGGLALFLLGRREGEESEESKPVVEFEELPAFSCENLIGVWLEPTEGNLPMTFSAYEDSFDYMVEGVLKSGPEGPSKQELILGALDHVASGCHWEDQLQYTPRMIKLYNAMHRVYDNVLAQIDDVLTGEGEE